MKNIDSFIDIPDFDEIIKQCENILEANYQKRGNTWDYPLNIKIYLEQIKKNVDDIKAEDNLILIEHDLLDIINFASFIYSIIERRRRNKDLLKVD